MQNQIIQDYLVCPACKGDLAATALQEKDGDIIDGVVRCQSCDAQYRLENGVLALVLPSLDAAKCQQRDFYDQDAIHYETEMLRLPFWQAQTSLYLQAIRSQMGGCASMLEIGCGTGRISLPYADSFKHILSFDLSESMVRIALEKRDQAKATNIHYFIGDAENIPVRSSSIDLAVFSGILHHVQSPGLVIKETIRTLAAHGRFLGIENNASAFRAIFDLLMRLNRLWNEKANDDHFIMNHRELKRWFSDAGVSAKTWTSIFLPPHALNLLPASQVKRTIRLTDQFCQRLPWLREQGGLILFSGSK